MASQEDVVGSTCMFSDSLGESEIGESHSSAGGLSAGGLSDDPKGALRRSVDSGERGEVEAF